MVARERADAAGRGEDRTSVRAELQRVVDRLLQDYRGEIPAGSVIRCVARSTEIATRYGVPKPALPSVVDRLARSTLDARSQAGLHSPPRLDDWLAHEVPADDLAGHHLGTPD